MNNPSQVFCWEVFRRAAISHESMSYVGFYHAAVMELVQQTREERLLWDTMMYPEQRQVEDWNSDPSHFSDGGEPDFVAGIRRQKALTAWRPTCRQKARHCKTWEVQKRPGREHRPRRRRSKVYLQEL